MTGVQTCALPIFSLATSLYRAAMTGLLSAAKEVREHGTFGYIDTSVGSAEMNEFLRE